MNVEFVWWGSSELIERLSKSEHIGRLFFWFGQRGFDQDWFHQHLDEAIRAAGPRYTPDIHVELPIAQDMERFSRSDFVFTEVKSLAIELREMHKSLTSAAKSLARPSTVPNIDDFLTATAEVLTLLVELQPSPAGPLPFVTIAEAAEKAAGMSHEIL